MKESEKMMKILSENKKRIIKERLSLEKSKERALNVIEFVWMTFGFLMYALFIMG